MTLTELRSEEWDQDYVWAVHCNIACPIMDELQGEWRAGICRDDDHLVIGLRRVVANKAAARIMKQLFNIDITKHKNWTFNEQDFD